LRLWSDGPSIAGNAACDHPMTYKINPPLIRFVLGLFVGALLTSCAIRTQVTALPVNAPLTAIYVQNNPAVLMNGLMPEIVKQLGEMGFQAIPFSGERPKEAHDYLTFTANWKWRYAIYLSYFNATLWHDEAPVGHAEYDARRVGLNPDKYGTTANKIRPLLQEFLKNVRPTNLAQNSFAGAALGPGTVAISNLPAATAP